VWYIGAMEAAVQRLGDPARLAAVHATGLLGAPPSPILDELCAGGAAAIGADAVLVTVLDDSRQWFAGAYGLEEPWASTRQTDLPASLCQYIPAPGEPLAVLDLANDEDFSGSGAVALGVGSYLGYPLCSADGDMLGALCAVRQRASTWTDTERAALKALALVCERYIRNEIVTRHDPSHDLAMVAHDIRNPLTILREVPPLLEQADDPAERRQLVDMVGRAATAVDSLVEDIITAGIPTSEAVPVRRTNFDLAAALRSVAASGAPGGPVVDVDVPDVLPVYADERAVRRIVENLLGNARRHGSPPIQLTARTTPGGVEVEVGNAGAPIPDDVRPHLFDRFRPGAVASSGTGLGLHIARRLAAAHRGTVELVEVDGHVAPTRFRLTLPQRRSR